jgi:hypothetical protein
MHLLVVAQASDIDVRKADRQMSSIIVVAPSERLASALGLIVDQAAGETRGGPDAGAETSVSGDCTNDSTTAGADGGARERALLAGRHVRTGSER